MKLFRKNPIVSFIILTFVLSYLLGMPVNFFLSAVLPKSAGVIKNYLPRILIVFSPAVSAIIISSSINGKEGVLNLISLLKPKKKQLWLIFILPFAGLIITIISFVSIGYNVGVFYKIIREHFGLLLLHFILQFALVGIGEEIGWRGWLLPQLTKLKSLWLSTLIVFLVWALWHFPVFLINVKITAAHLIMLYSLSVLFSFLLYKVKENIFIIAAVHASVNFPLFFLENSGIQILNKASFLNAWLIISFIYLILSFVVIVMYPGLWFKKVKLL